MMSNKKIEEAPRVLTPDQQRIRNLVDSSPKEAPVIEGYKDNFHVDLLAVPDFVKKGDEYDYAWLSLAELDKDLYHGSKWAIVSRINHPHVPRERWDDATGGITFRGQNILAFCRRETREAEQKAIVDSFNKRTESALKVKDQAQETPGMIEPGTGGMVTVEEAIDPGEQFDYEQ